MRNSLTLCAARKCWTTSPVNLSREAAAVVGPQITAYRTGQNTGACFMPFVDSKHRTTAHCDGNATDTRRNYAMWDGTVLPDRAAQHTAKYESALTDRRETVNAILNRVGYVERFPGRTYVPSGGVATAAEWSRLGMCKNRWQDYVLPGSNPELLSKS